MSVAVVEAVERECSHLGCYETCELEKAGPDLPAYIIDSLGVIWSNGASRTGHVYYRSTAGEIALTTWGSLNSEYLRNRSDTSFPGGPWTAYATCVDLPR